MTLPAPGNPAECNRRVDKASSAKKVIKLSSGFKGAVGGVDDVGVESIFEASFGFDGLLADAMFSFSDLPGPSPNTDDLLKLMFDEFLADLPSALDPLLSLDLVHDTINFDSPDDQENYFVQTFSTDSLTEATFRLEIEEAPEPLLPEPATIALLGLGLAGIGFSRRRRRH